MGFLKARRVLRIFRIEMFNDSMALRSIMGQEDSAFHDHHHKSQTFSFLLTRPFHSF